MQTANSPLRNSDRSAPSSDSRSKPLPNSGNNASNSANAWSPHQHPGLAFRNANTTRINSTSGSHNPPSLTPAEKERVVNHIRRLMAEAEEFFITQQNLLKMTHAELSKHVDQIKYRAQFFVNTNDGLSSGPGSGNRHNYSVPMPLNALTSGAAKSGGFPFGAGAGAGGGLVDGSSGFNGATGFPRSVQQQLSAMSATPLRPTNNGNPTHVTGTGEGFGGGNGMGGAGREVFSTNTPRFAVSPLSSRGANTLANGNMAKHSSDFTTNGFQVSGSPHLPSSGVRGFTYSTSAMNLGNGVQGAGTSTPPAKHLRLATDSKSPSVSTLVEDVIASRGGPGTGSPINDWGSLSLANNTASSLDVTQSMTASPQFTNTLSLDDLLARFVGASSGGLSTQDEGTVNPLGGSAGMDAANINFDNLYEQLISGEKSKSPENDANANSAVDSFGVFSTNHTSNGITPTPLQGQLDAHIGSAGNKEEASNGDRFGSIGFAVTAGNDSARTTSGGLSGGSLFDRNTPATAATPSQKRDMGGDRFNFGSATHMFSTAANPVSHTPTKLAQQQRSPSALSSSLQGGTNGASPKQQQQQQQHTDPAAATYALLNNFDKRDVIPIDSIRSLCDHHLTKTVQAVYEKGRPRVEPIPGSEGLTDDPAALGIAADASCQVLVEFKRKRVLQYDSDTFVAPGRYVVVGGDRGEDLGLVIYAWCETSNKKTASTGADGVTADKVASPAGKGDKTASGNKSGVVGIGLAGSTLTRSIGVGNGTVLRLATDSEVSKLLSVQAELESRAVDACGQRVLDHALPMVIVDAEYQFDKKKLTFFYEAQQRMDFRDLVRDLYKTFRARIWMELVDV